MSDPSEPPAAPEEGAPAPSDESETQRILKELAGAIDSGNDLTIKKVRQSVCHDIEARLQVPYGNVTKQVPKALRMAAEKNGGPPAERVKRNLGGASSTVTIPPPAAAETPAPEPAAPAQASPPAPSKPKMSDVYRAAANEAELKKTPEYRWLEAQVKTGITFVDGIYKQIGLVDDKGIMGQAMLGVDMVDLTVQMCMKYDWSVPDRIEKLVFFGAWGALLVMPALAKFGILDDIKSGNLGKKKDAKKSDEPLTNTETKV
ncbi:MAG: hypothetical protein QXJ74_05240 [Nitrososphaera sp.]